MATKEFHALTTRELLAISGGNTTVIIEGGGGGYALFSPHDYQKWFRWGRY